MNDGNSALRRHCYELQGGRCPRTWSSSGPLRPSHPFSCLGDALELPQGEMAREMLQITLDEINIAFNVPFCIHWLLKVLNP